MKNNSLLLELCYQNGKMPDRYYNQLNGISLNEAYQKHRKQISSYSVNQKQHFQLTPEQENQISEEIEIAVNDLLNALKTN